jgi:SAM-dependent methyltransferase
MSENQSIHEFDLETICRYFLGLHRQGPGSKEAGLHALSYVTGLTQTSAIADLGCGTGTPTLMLAEACPGQITGLDLFPAFIQKLNDRAAEAGLQHRLRGICGSMDALPFQEASLDLIWSEGAIYNIGFERGMREWRRYLKPGGYVAVSEACWFTPERPREIEEFWTAYPEIGRIGDKTAQMEEAGFRTVAVFALPDTCWTDEFFAPQQQRQLRFLEEELGNTGAETLVQYMRHESEMYRRYGAYYGYVFFIGRREE